MSLRFLVVSSATNQVVGSFTPNKWELVENVVGAGSGLLQIPVPVGPTQAATDRAKAALRRATQPRARWVAAVDSDGNVLWSGPVARQITYDGKGLLSLNLIDWKGWFYRAALRPGFAGGAPAAIYNRKATELATLFNDMFRAALNHPKAPKMFRDGTPATGVKKDLKAALLDRSIGDIADDLQGRDRGADWWTYAVMSKDMMSCAPHVKVGFPERTTGKTIRVEWRDGQGGNLAEAPTWPDSEEFPSVAWATGDDQPPKQVIAFDKVPTLYATGSEDIVWETVENGLAGVKKKAAAFDHARAAVQRGVKAYGTWPVVIAEERLNPASYQVGDRARTILQNDWDSYDLPAVRIMSRTLTGGRGEPSAQRLELNLADFNRPSKSGRPGIPGVTHA